MTVLELVAAIVILGIAVTPVLTYFFETCKKSVLPERHTKAYFLAIEKMEEIIADRHSSLRGYSYLDTANYPDESLSGGYSRSVTFTEVSSTDLSTEQSGSGYKKISVTVSYSPPAGSYTLSYVVCDLS